MRLLLLLAAIASVPACRGLASEGEVCNDTACEPQFACVADVGAEYGDASSDDVCERPRAIYDIIAYGERGENRRVDEALAMIDGTFRLPRFTESTPSMATVPHPATLADGRALGCTGLTRGDARACAVPDWKRYYGVELSQYDRFYFYGLRPVSSLIYTAYFSPAKRLQLRYAALAGKPLDADGIQWLRREAGSLALAMIDSFIAQGHRPFALARMPACYAGASGYQNPNAAWAPALAHWDPAMRIDRGRLDQAEDVPADCAGAIPHTYFTLRDSLWYPHAVAFRAMVLANSYFLFRGELSADQRDGWLRAIRDTGDALALPSSYEPNQNHGVSESAALMQLASDFALLVPPDEVAGWMALGRYRLNDLIVDTVFADGVQVEQSPMYHNYQIVLLLQILDWMEARGLDLTTGIDPAAGIDYDAEAPAPVKPDVSELTVSPDLEPRAIIDRMVRASLHLAQPDGWIPWIGSSVPQQYRGYQDDVLRRYIDEGRPFAAQLRFFQSAGKAGTPPTDAERLTVFEDAGFVTMHSAFTPDFARQTQVVFNTGIAYHKHSHPDALAVHLFGPDTAPGAATGMALLVDSGWYSYESLGTFFFKSTLAHNTVNVDGQNQCVRTPVHMRLDPYVDGQLPSCAELAALEPGAGAVRRGRSLQGALGETAWLYQAGGHTLYRGTEHRRAVLLLGRHILVVVDMLQSDAPRTFSQTWHLAPRIPPLPAAPAGEGGAYHLQFARSADDPAPLMSLHEATEGAELQLHFGDPPVGGVYGQGWYSMREDEAEPNAVVELRRAGVTSTAFASVFLLGPLAGQHADVELHRDATWSGGVTIRIEGGESISLDIANLGDAATEVVEVSRR